MDKIERIDKILEAVGTKIQAEVEGLLATDFTLEALGKELASKADAFASVKGKQVCAQIEIVGDISGIGCLLVGIKDAIRLGGTLIMLPASELDEVIGREEYSEEIEDSYGEIANIIAGSFTTDFEEMYPKPCRFIRKEQEIVVPSEVDVDSQQPVENQTYYQAAFKMTLDGRAMGNLVMLLPAATFELEEDLPVEQETVIPEPDVEPSDMAGGEQGPEGRTISTLSYDKKKKKIDLLLEESRETIESELSALMGVEIFLSDLENRELSKQGFFSETISGKHILAEMEVVGDFQDTSYFAISTKDAIFLGGTLIMLPPSELDLVVSEGDFGEDSRDAYGEIANIISGAYTRVFEEKHFNKLRFIRKDLHEVKPIKVDISSEEPIPDRMYYTSSMSVLADGKVLGQMHMLIPVDVLQLQEETASTQSDSDPVNVEPQTGEIDQQDHHAQDAEPVQQNLAPDIDKSGLKAEAEKHKINLDKLLEQCRETMMVEVGALLGVELMLADPENVVINKGDFFTEEVFEKQVIADLDIVGDVEGKGYLSLDIGDAIRIGGILIMLPDTELEAAVSGKNFSEDTVDAYGEIANIISGVYSAVFEEQYYKKIRFIRAELTQVVPVKVEIEDEKPIPNQHYYLSKMDILLAGKPLGKLNMLLPLDLLDLDGLVHIEPDIAVQQVDVPLADTGAIRNAIPEIAADHADGYQRSEVVDILLVSDDENEAGKICRALRESGYAAKSISLKESIHNYIPGHLKAVYLVMREVNEQAFGVAIQVSSSSSLPIIAAGPGWTRSKVIKAVKYGVLDILLTPASDQDIKENIANNILKLAA